MVAGDVVKNPSGIVNGVAFAVKLIVLAAPGVNVPDVLAKGIAAFVIRVCPLKSNSPLVSVRVLLRVSC